VLVLGLDNAGKTTLLEKIKSIYLGTAGLPPDKITPTIGLNIGKLEMGHMRMQFWDLGFYSS
jgi:ADP-ribosylation factor related protein 1